MAHPRTSLGETLDRTDRLALTADLLARRADDPGQERAVEDRIVKINMPVARDIARRFEGRGIAADDLEQVAYLGLLKAVRGYDSDRGGEFLRFAVPTIRGELRRWFRDAGWMVRPPRSIQELQPRINQAHEDLEQRLGREPDTAEVAEALGESPAAVRRALAAHGCFQPTSLDLPSGSDGEEQGAPVHRMGDEDPGFERAEALVMLRPVWRTLDDDERMMLEMWFFRGATQAEIGRRLGVAQTQVSRLISALLKRMREQIEGTGALPAAA